MTARQCEREARRIAPGYKAKAFRDSFGRVLLFINGKPCALRGPFVERLDFICPTYECCLAALREWVKGRKRT